jgi:beta-lactam-binding protein with PASTA domain
VQAAIQEVSVQEEESAASELKLKELVKQLQKVEATARSGGTALQQLCASDIADAEVCC